MDKSELKREEFVMYCAIDYLSLWWRYFDRIQLQLSTMKWDGRVRKEYNMKRQGFNSMI
jgi:hypothetical protein